MRPNLGPNYDLARRLSKLEQLVAGLNTRDVLRNASIGAGGLTVTGSGGITITGGGSLTVTGTGTLNVAAGGLNSAGSITAATNITAGGTLTGAALHVTGNSQVDGSETVNGLVNGIGGIQSADARSRILSTGYVGMWADSSGRFGQSPSSLRFKQDVRPAKIDTAGFRALTPIEYRLIVAVEEFGDDARVETGFSAEEVEKVAPWAVYYDADGRVEGINYDRLVVGLLAVVQELSEQVNRRPEHH